MEKYLTDENVLANRIAEEVFASDIGGELNYSTKEIKDNQFSFKTWDDKKQIIVTVSIKDL